MGVIGRLISRILPFVRVQSRAMCSWEPADRVKFSKPSIWVEFTTLATECKAVNLGQGFPDGPMPKFVADLMKDIAEHPERTDWHQYTRGFGHPRLVNILSKIYGDFYNTEIKPNDQILVTVGAYLALYYTFLGWVNHGDEVLIIEPAYDCYAPQVRMAGGVPVSVVMNLKEDAKTSGDYTLNLAELEAKCNSKTKLLVLNNPNNPTGKLFTRQELEGIAEIARKKDLIVVADEVYEWHVWGDRMIRFASLPGMFERTISIGSAGKAFSVTGWKLGWVIAPENLMAPLRMVHQNCIFTCSTPIQEAVARAFEIEYPMLKSRSPSSYLCTGLSSELQQKRDRLAAMLKEAGFQPIIPDSGYFMMAYFRDIDAPFRDFGAGDDPMDFRFVRWLCKEKKLAAIPPSAFYCDEHKTGNDNLIRLCYMKTDTTLDAAHEILKNLKK